MTDGGPPYRLQHTDRPGIKAEGPLLYNMRGEVARLLGRDNTNFPGAQPVSFARKHLQELRNDECVFLSPSVPIKRLLRRGLTS